MISVLILWRIHNVVRSSHAPREALDALLRQAGVVRVDNMHQLFDVAQLLLHQPLPAGPRIGIVGNSQAMAVLIADAAISEGLEVGAEPVTVRSEPTTQEFREALQRCYAQEQVDAVVACCIPPLGEIHPDILRALSEASAASGKTTVACLLGVRGVAGVEPDEQSPAAGDDLASSLPAYSAPEDAVVALASVVRYAQWRHRDFGVRVDPQDVDRAGARELIERLLSGIDHSAHVQMADDDIATLLACYGLTVRPEATVTVPDGVSCVLRTMEDGLLGPIVSFGLAGDVSDLLGDVAHRVPPLTNVDVSDLIRTVRAAPRLTGYRGAPPLDVAGLEDVVARLSCLADDLPQIAELELNPVIVAERGVTIASVTAVLSHPVARTDGARRSLAT